MYTSCSLSPTFASIQLTIFNDNGGYLVIKLPPTNSIIEVAMIEVAILLIDFFSRWPSFRIWKQEMQRRGNNHVTNNN